MSKEKSRQHTLFFPYVNTRFMESCGVKLRKKDKWLSESKPHIGELELRTRECRGGKDHACDEAKVRVAELKALTEAKIGSSRKNKFSSLLPSTKTSICSDQKGQIVITMRKAQGDHSVEIIWKKS